MVTTSPQTLAHQAVQRAVRAGSLVPSPCVICRDTPTLGHHPHGYDEDHRLDVVWLCRRCHERIHGRSSISASVDLRAKRQAAGITIRDLEQLTGINRGRLSVLERGVPPSTKERQAILGALGSLPGG